MKVGQWVGLLTALVVMTPIISASATETLNGKVLYESNCAVCHGATGEISNYGKQLKPFPARNLRAIANLISRNEMRRIIMYGIEGSAMTPKKYALNALQIESVMDYIQTFDYIPNMVNGKNRFKAVCSVCHGMNGRGQTGLGAKNLVYTKLNLREIVHTMRYGLPGTMMTSKRYQLSNTDIADVASYVYSLRYMANPARGKTLYGSNCSTCHTAPNKIKLIGNVDASRSITDLSDRLLALRIRHGPHADRDGKKVSKLSADDVQDIIAYIRAYTH